MKCYHILWCLNIPLQKKNKNESNELTKLKKKHQEEILFLKNSHSKELNDIKKKNEEDIQFWKDCYLHVKQYLEIVLNLNLHQR